MRPPLPGTQNPRLAKRKSRMCCSRVLCRRRGGGLPSPHPPPATPSHCLSLGLWGGVTQQTCQPCPHNRHVCCVTQQTFSLAVASQADMLVVSHSTHVSCVAPRTSFVCRTADTSPVPCSGHVFCVTQQTCLLCHAVDTPAASNSRHVLRGTQQTCLLCHTAHMSAVVRQLIPPTNSLLFSSLLRTGPVGLMNRSLHLKITPVMIFCLNAF